MIKLSKTLTAAALACGLALSAGTGASAAGFGSLSGLKSAAPQSPIVEVRGRGARNALIGAAIIGTGLAIAGAAHADRRRHRYYDRHERCDWLDYKCSQGHDWACRKYDYRCAD